MPPCRGDRRVQKQTCGQKESGRQTRGLAAAPVSGSRCHDSVRPTYALYAAESFWAMLKRGYIGTYHNMSVRHIGLYVNEFAGRHNARQMDTADQMGAMVHGAHGKRMRYADLTAS